MYMISAEKLTERLGILERNQHTNSVLKSHSMTQSYSMGQTITTKLSNKGLNVTDWMRLTGILLSSLGVGIFLTITTIAK